MRLSDIPLTERPAGEPEPTRTLTGLRRITGPRTRRSVLRGIVLSGLTLGTFALTLGTRSERRAYAETGPGGLTGWDRNDCRDAYPGGYDEQRDAVGSRYRNAPAACFGSALISSAYCARGWHRSDEVRSGDEIRRHTPETGMCGGRNSWRWRTPAGRVFRCSDGWTTVTVGGSENTYFTICRAEVAG